MTDPVQNVASTVSADAAKVAAAAQVAESKVQAADATLTTFIQNHAGKIALAVLIVVGIVVWRLI